MTSQHSTAQQVEVDYLGHPCKVAEALDNFAESVKEARETAAREPREIRRQIGIRLVELSARMEHLSNAIDVARDGLADSAGADGPRAVLEMAAQYALQDSNKFFDFAGLVLHAIENQPPVTAGAEAK